ncbi:MAG TPA: FAD-dependent oxidoreductase, partial [Gemmatimonadaceae bacterium]|nr:FAD-dependent oxidoreductase [Gemmatimonadaceae bacterium]
YPSYLEELAEETGIRVPLNRLGVLQVALSERGVQGLRKTAGPGSTWLDRADLATLEPTLGHALGAVHNPDDGAVDNVILLSALEHLASVSKLITRVAGNALSVDADADCARVALESGARLESSHVVLAPGAWGGQIGGAGYLQSIQPSRGQLVSYDAIGLRHVTYGPRGYLVPRTAGTVIAGSTMENAGFVSETTPEGLAKVRSAAEEIAPALAIAFVNASWAGLRPVTPDMLPILGRDPGNARIVYACGHSRNGILLAPITGETVAELVTEEPLSHDLSQFHPARFSG